MKKVSINLIVTPDMNNPYKDNRFYRVKFRGVDKRFRTAKSAQRWLDGFCNDLENVAIRIMVLNGLVYGLYMELYSYLPAYECRIYDSKLSSAGKCFSDLYRDLEFTSLVKISEMEAVLSNLDCFLNACLKVCKKYNQYFYVKKVNSLKKMVESVDIEFKKLLNLDSINSIY